MAATDKCYLFLIPKEEQHSIIPWSADKDCWSYLGNHRDEFIEVDIGDMGILGYTANSDFAFVYKDKLYKNNRVIIDVSNNCCIFICYESMNDSDDITKDYPNDYPDKKPTYRY